MHSNGDLSVNGNPTAELPGGFTSSGLMDISGNPCIGSGQCDEDPQPEAYVLSDEADKNVYEGDYSGQPQIPIPAINPALVAPNVAALGILLLSGRRLCLPHSRLFSSHCKDFCRAACLSRTRHALD